MLANIRHENSDIQFAVLRCLGLCCILDKNLAKQNVSLFLECLKEEEGDVKVILQTVFDMGVTFGMEHFNNQDDQVTFFFFFFFSLSFLTMQEM